MMEVPSTPWGDLPDQPEKSAPVAARWHPLPGRVEHTFTHFHLELDVWRAESVIDGQWRDDGDYRWTGRDELSGAALPTVMRKVVALALGAGGCRRRSARIAAARYRLTPALRPKCRKAPPCPARGRPRDATGLGMTESHSRPGRSARRSHLPAHHSLPLGIRRARRSASRPMYVRRV